jgi:hypothetical protein
MAESLMMAIVQPLFFVWRMHVVYEALVGSSGASQTTIRYDLA